MTTIAIDTETTGLNPWKGSRPFMIAWAYDADGVFNEFKTECIEAPVNPATKEVDWNDIWPTPRMLEFLKLTSDPKVEKVFHNAKFDLRMLGTLGISVSGPIHDTYIASRCCNTLEESYGLKELGKKYLGIERKAQDRLHERIISLRRLPKIKRQVDLSDAVSADYWLEQLANPRTYLCEDYCRNDCRLTMSLWLFFQDGLRKLKRYRSYEKEMELMPVIMKMEEFGVRIDLKKVDEQINELEKELSKTEINIKSEINDWSINLNSSKQLVKLFYEKLGLPVEKTTEKGQPSVDVATLKKHKDKSAVVAGILHMRGIEKGLTYFKQYKELNTRDTTISMEDFCDWSAGCIHCNFNQFGARTARLSCNSPNLQNVSNPETSGGEEVVNARLPFVPRNGYVWLTFDYSGFEARIFASRAEDELMLDAFLSGRDLHDECGKRAFGDRLPPGQRRKLAKNIFFCKIFGGGPGVLAEKYEVSYDEAKKILKEYDAAFPNIRQHLQKIADFASGHGYIINAFNRYIDVESGREYAACNYDVQSSAADMIKRAMINVNNYLDEVALEYDARLLLSIHDELIIECNKKTLDLNFIHIIKNLMEDHGGAFCLPMPVECSIIKRTWAEKKKLEV